MAAGFADVRSVADRVGLRVVWHTASHDRLKAFVRSLAEAVRKPVAQEPGVEAAAKALGHLARAGGILIVDRIEFEIRRSLEWMEMDR